MPLLNIHEKRKMKLHFRHTKERILDLFLMLQRKNKRNTEMTALKKHTKKFHGLFQFLKIWLVILNVRFFEFSFSHHGIHVNTNEKVMREYMDDLNAAQKQKAI